MLTHVASAVSVMYEKHSHKKIDQRDILQSSQPRFRVMVALVQRRTLTKKLEMIGLTMHVATIAGC